jgi:hypothetical protein
MTGSPLNQQSHYPAHFFNVRETTTVMNAADLKGHILAYFNLLFCHSPENTEKNRGENHSGWLKILTRFKYEVYCHHYTNLICICEGEN